MSTSSFAAISMIWYFVHGRRNFTGPPVPKDQDPTMLQGAVVDDDERVLDADPEMRKVPKVE